MGTTEISTSVLLISLIVLSGCASSVTDGSTSTHGPTHSPPPTTTETQINTTTQTTTNPDHQTISPGERLVIDKEVQKNVTVFLYDSADSDFENHNSTETPSEKPLASVTYPANQTGQIHVTEFEPEGHIVISVDNSVVWQTPISRYDFLRLRINESGSVKIITHSTI